MTVKKKNILFIPGAKPKWTYLYLCKKMAEHHHVYVLLEDNYSGYKDWIIKNTNSITPYYYQPLKYIKILEYAIRLFVKKPHTKFLENTSRRTKYNTTNVVFRHIPDLFPKFISPNTAAKILSLLPSTYKSDLRKLNIDEIFYVSVHINHFYPVCAGLNIVKEITCWIYSWDNPFKDTFLPSIFSKYFIWNEFMKNDLHELHKVPLKKQTCVGPVQFDYLKFCQIDTKLAATLPKYYLLFTFGTNNKSVSQEKGILLLLSNVLWGINREYRIVARTYPGTKDDDNKTFKQTFNNVIFYDTDKYEYDADFEQINTNKYTLLKQASGVINIGTTMGLEAAFLDKPVIQIAFLPESVTAYTGDKRFFNIDVILENDHLKKYVLNYEYINVVKNMRELDETLNMLLCGDNRYLLDYSMYLRNLIDPDIKELSINKLTSVL